MLTLNTLPRRPRGRPAHNGNGYTDTRELLIRRGIEVLTERGISATSLDEVLKSVNVPKGSFYHYFASKDAFVTAALEAYANYFARKLSLHFGNGLLMPLDRLGSFVEDACNGMERHDYSRGCLVGNLGQEICCINENLRQRLEQIFGDWERRLAACLADAVTQGQLAANADCTVLAHAFWIGWEGAILRARLSRSTAPMRVYFQLFLSALPPA